MNLREIIKKLRSPMGKALVFLIAIIIMTLAMIPFLMRDDAGKLEAGDTESRTEGTYEIPGTVKPIQSGKRSGDSKAIEKRNPGVITEGKSVRPPTTPRPPVDRSRSSDFRTTVRNTAPPSGPTITVIDGENSSNNNVFVSERFAPYGRMISCKMINTVESGNTQTPLIAVVTGDLWWTNTSGEKKLIIPAGTEVHGSIDGSKPVRNRLVTGNNFVLVWQASSNMVGFELQLKGIALEKSTYPDNPVLATISDMSAGIPGQVVSNENLSKFMMYTLAFAQGVAQGYQTTEVYTDSGVTISTQDGTTKSAIARGTETLAQVMLQDVSQMIAKESYYIRVAAGTEFYLFVQQVINLDDAKVADTLLNQLEEKKSQSEQPRQSHRNVLNSFSQK